MNGKGLRHGIVTGNFTLPAAFACAALMWFADSTDADIPELWWGGFGATTLTAYMLLELNNRNALLRIRSRMVSSMFLLLAAAMTFNRNLSWDFLPPACLVMAYMLLFHAYQNSHSQGYVFHAFLFMGIGALAFPKLLLLTPFFLLAMLVQLRSMTAKSFFASVLGTALPLLLREVYVMYTGAPSKIYTFWSELTAFPHPDFTLLNEHRIVSAAFMLLISAAGAIHFSRTKFNDKIRTRMFFYVILLEELATAALLVAQPQLFSMTFPLFLANSSIIIAHHLAFARGPVADIYFYALLLSLAFLAFYNHSGYTFGLWQN